MTTDRTVHTDRAVLTDRTVLLLRHARAEPGDAATPDADRPLAPRGRSACASAARFLARLPPPDLVLSSDSARTRETVELIAPAWPSEIAVIYSEDLYLAPPEDLLAHLRALDDGVRTVMLVGHNPGLHLLAATLVKPAERGRLASFPTSALLIATTDIGRWSDLRPGRSALVSFTTFR